MLFLTGVPLFIYKSSGGKLADTIYVMLLVTFTIFLMKKVIGHTTRLHPRLITGLAAIGLVGGALIFRKLEKEIQRLA